MPTTQEGKKARFADNLGTGARLESSGCNPLDFDNQNNINLISNCITQEILINFLNLYTKTLLYNIRKNA